MGRIEKDNSVTAVGQSFEDAAPPSYTAQPASSSLSPEDVEQLNSAFSSLNLPVVAQDVTPDTCLAHLKLLFAFQTLKETIGFADGLWGIYDSRVFPSRKDASTWQDNEKLDDETKRSLALLREKRWALYVARAADRYESWWNSFYRNPLTEIDMGEDTDKYNGFFPKDLSNANDHFWKSDQLPPLGKRRSLFA